MAESLDPPPSSCQGDASQRPLLPRDQAQWGN
jgi:hypothetical protein